MGDEIQGTSDPGFDAGSYVDQLERQAAEMDRLQHEIMGYQSPGGEYDRGHEHGSAVAAELNGRLGRALGELHEARVEIDRLRREVEFEALGRPVALNGLSLPVCACVTDEQASQLGPGFSRPVCAVHPERPVRTLTPGHEPRIPSLCTEPLFEDSVDQTVRNVGGDPLSDTPWADPEYKGGEPE